MFESKILMAERSGRILPKTFSVKIKWFWEFKNLFQTSVQNNICWNQQKRIKSFRKTIITEKPFFIDY